MDFSYRLSDFLLFAPRTYYRQFELLNRDLWPWHLGALLAGLVLLVLIWRRPRHAGRIAALILASALASTAWFYVHLRYAQINWAADWLALALAAQAALLFVSGAVFDRLRPAEARIGVVFIVVGVLLQPLVALAVGRAWHQGEVFALAPDPTILATLGVILCAARIPWELVVLPLLWCVVSILTLYTMDAPEAWWLAALTLAAATALIARARA